MFFTLKQWICCSVDFEVHICVFSPRQLGTSAGNLHASTSRIHTEFLYIALLFEDSIYLLVYVILRLEMTAVKRLKYTVL